MSPFERAKQYVAIFINVGDLWRSYVPCDASPGDGESIHLQGAHLQRLAGSTWRITYDGKSQAFRAGPLAAQAVPVAWPCPTAKALGEAS